MHRATSLALAVLLLAIAMTTTAAERDRKLLATGRALSEQFEAGQTAALVARMTPALRQELGGAEGLTELRERVLREEGPETGLIQEDTEVAGAQRIYRRIARRNVGSMPTLMEWTLDDKDRVVALIVRPQAIAIPSGKGNY
jgi:hypothetical protein